MSKHVRNLLRAAILLLVSLAATLAGAQTQPISLYKLLGSWVGADGKNIWISKLDEHRLKLAGGSNLDWRGTYEGNKFQFSVKPTAEAMNPDIPGWARDRVAKQGSLVWKLNLTASEDKDGLKLTGELLPGEVDWQEISDPNTSEVYKQTVKVTGAPGAPIKLTYSKVPNWWINDTLVVAAQPGKSTPRGTAVNYVLFAYGPSLPGLRRELKGVLSDSDGIDYTVIGANGDRAVMAGADQALMAKGWSQATDQLSASDADWVKKNWGALLIEARVGGNVYPGRYTYRIGGAKGGWFLTRGTAKATVKIWRELPDSPGEPTQYAFPGERIHLQIDALERSLTPWTSEIPLIVGVNGTWMNVGEGSSSMRAKFDHSASTGSSIFMSPTVRLVHDDDPALPPQRKVAMVGGDMLLAVNDGDMVQIGLANPRQFIVDAPEENVNIVADDEGPWVNALRRAAIADGMPKDAESLRQSRGKTVDEVSNVMITQVAFKLRLQYLSPLVRFIQAGYGFSDAEMAQGDIVARNKITLGNHAATLLLRDEFVAQMQPLVDELNAISSEDDQVAYMDAMRSEIAKENSPIGSLEVLDPSPDLTAPTNVASHTVHELYTMPFFTQRRDLQRPWLVAAFRSYRKAVIDAQQKAIDLGDGDIQGLLALTGDCFAPIVKTLVPKLMRPVHDDKGNTTWQPDTIARMEVKTLSTTWEAVKAQKEWSSIDSEVAIAAVTCALPMFSEAGAFLKAAAAANIGFAGYAAGQSAYSYFYSDLAKQAFAVGAYRLLGSEPFDQVQAQRTPGWAVVLNLIGLGLIANGELPRLMGQMPAGHAMALAPRAVAAIEKGGIKAFALLPAEEQAAFFDAATAVATERATLGGVQLAKNEEDIAQAIEKIQQELKSRGGFQVRPPEGQIATVDPPTVLPERLQVTRIPQGEPLPPIADETNAATKVSPPETPARAPPAAENPAPPPSKPANPLDKTAAAYRLKRIGGKTLALGEINDVAGLKTLGKLPKGFPEAAGVWVFKGQSLTLGDKIGEGAFMVVFEEVGTSSVIKISKQIGDPARLSLEEMQAAEKVLTEAEIPHLKIEPGPAPMGDEAFWLRQQRLPEGAVIPKFKEFLSASKRKAVMDLVDKMHEAGIAFEDCKADNIFLTEVAPDSNQWTAGILDVDRCCKWGRYTESIDNILANFEAGFWRNDCLIPGGATAGSGRLMSLDEFWKFQLKKGGWLDFGRKGFENKVLSADEAFKRFKWLGKSTEKIDLRGRTASPTGGVRRPLLLLTYGGRMIALRSHRRTDHHENLDIYRLRPRLDAGGCANRGHERTHRVDPRALHQRGALRVASRYGKRSGAHGRPQRQLLCAGRRGRGEPDTWKA